MLRRVGKTTEPFYAVGGNVHCATTEEPVRSFLKKLKNDTIRSRNPPSGQIFGKDENKFEKIHTPQCSHQHYLQ